MASFFPEAVRAGLAGNPFYFVLGGVAGLLPDTLDFKFYRYFYRHDMEVIPDPLNFNPQMIADAVALAITRAWIDRKPVVIKLDTIRLGADRWQQYAVVFDTAQKKVVVTQGPVVSTSRTPLEGTPHRTASASVVCGIRPDYETTTVIDIFDGPVFRMERTADERVMPEFIPWHRQWSHSITLSAVAGLTCGAAFGVPAGAIAALAIAAHIAVDQCGFLGSNLFFPLTRSRTTGLQLTHSDSPLPNFCATIVSMLIVFANLHEGSARIFPNLTIAGLLLYAALPVSLFLLARRIMAKRRDPAARRLNNHTDCV